MKATLVAALIGLSALPLWAQTVATTAGTDLDAERARLSEEQKAVDARYLTERLRTAQVVPTPVSTETVAFGSTVTFSRADGRVQTYRIVGEDEADPKEGSISFVAPVAKSLMGKAVGDVVGTGAQEIEILAIG